MSPSPGRARGQAVVLPSYAGAEAAARLGLPLLCTSASCRQARPSSLDGCGCPVLSSRERGDVHTCLRREQEEAVS
jgi:hypothetical protein